MNDLYRVNLAEVFIESLVKDGTLVPVERCEHGNYARHIIESSIRLVGIAEPESEFDWCLGAGIGGET